MILYLIPNKLNHSCTWVNFTVSIALSWLSSPISSKVAIIAEREVNTALNTALIEVYRTIVCQVAFLIALLLNEALAASS